MQKKMKSKSNQVVAENKKKKGKGKLQDGESDEVETDAKVKDGGDSLVQHNTTQACSSSSCSFSDRVFGLHVSKR
jgi:hypothetical protein